MPSFSRTSNGRPPLPVPPLLLCLLLLHSGAIIGCWCLQYKVGDLDSWGIPPPSKSRIYDFWTRFHHFRVGDSLLFLYPPSEDSVILVTQSAFNSCSIADPLLKLDDGNSVINLTAPGWYYFTSGVPGRCEKQQKLAVGVPLANGTFLPPSAEAPVAGSATVAGGSVVAAGPAGTPSTYPLVFGPSASQSSSAPEMVVHPSAAAFGTLVAIAAALALALF